MRNITMKRLEQILLLTTCLIMMMVAAVQRDGTLWGRTSADFASVDSIQNIREHTVRTFGDSVVVINTSLIGKDILGYVGQVPLEITIKGGRIKKVDALRNKETPEFFNRAKSLLGRWNGKTVNDALKQDVDAVSGATFSSNAIIQNVRVGLSYAAKNTAKPSVLERMDLRLKTIVGLFVVLMAAIIPLFYRNKTWHTVQMALNVVVLGLWCGTFLNWSLFVGYMSSGINLWVSLIPIVMLITAFVYPLFGKQGYYCVNVCPFGSLQDLASRAKHTKWKMSQRLVKSLMYFRQFLFALLMVLMLTGVSFQWMDYEVFSAFIFMSASVVVVVLAVVFVVLAIFLPRPYCRFVCPTGTFLRAAEGHK